MSDELIWFLGLELYRASFSGVSPKLHELLIDLTHPKPGDLVFECSRRHPDGRGRLILHRQEFVPFKEEESGYHDEFWYIEKLDGKLMKWSNCEFVKVPEPTPVSETWVADAIVRHGLDAASSEQ